MKTGLLCEVCGAGIVTRYEPCSTCGYVQGSQRAALATSVAKELDEFPPGYLLKGRYRIQQKVGQGGFGLVYRAWDEQRKRLVAVKQITLAALSAQEMIEVTGSYNRETMLLPKLRHKSIPQLYHHFTDPGHWYIVMQYIEGQTLEEVLAQAPQGRLPLGEALRIGAALCDVLSYLHRQEPAIVFRDVKPANIMRATNGKVYLIDFGIARYYRDGQRKDTRPLGSPGYAAPEQYGKAQSTPSTDMYGLGATLQTLLTGREPDELRVNGTSADVTFPKEVQTLLAQMLAPDPKQRPSSMRATSGTLSKLSLFYAPFNWWWFLGIAFVGSIEPLFVAGTFGLPLLMFFLAVIILAYYALQAHFKQTLSRKNLRALVEKSLNRTLQATVILWGISNQNLMLTAFLPQFQLSRLIGLIAYLAISVSSIILMRFVFSRLPQKAKVKQLASTSQQSIVLPPMEQKMR